MRIWALRVAFVAVALAAWEALAASGLLFRDVVPSLAAIGAAVARVLGTPGLLCEPRRDGAGNRHRGGHRRARRPRDGHPARQQPLPVAGVRVAAALSRADAQDHLLPGDDHVVRRGSGLQDRDGRRVVLLSDRDQHRGRDAPDRRGADSRRAELSRVALANDPVHLPARDARADRHGASPGPRRRDHRHAARGDQALEQGAGLPRHPGLCALRHAADVCAADPAVRALDRSQRADRAASRVPRGGLPRRSSHARLARFRSPPRGALAGFGSGVARRPFDRPRADRRRRLRAAAGQWRNDVRVPRSPDPRRRCTCAPGKRCASAAAPCSPACSAWASSRGSSS